jgi:hypothetical protein
MAREAFEIEKLLRISKENSNTDTIDILFGSGAPGGDAGEQDEAAIGSLYLRKNGSSSTIYQKVAGGNATSDWQENGSSAVTVGTWRPEKIRAVTSENVGNGVRDLTATPFSDDDTPFLTAADFSVGEFIIDNSSVTPVLREVTAVSAPNITLSDPVSAPALAENDTFVAINYLPDSPGNQESQAIVNYNGSVMIKISDFDWALATGIDLSGSYSAATGDAAAGDSVEEALQKIDGNVDELTTAVGISQGDNDMGTYTGALLNDNESAKQNLQQLESEAESIRALSGTALGDNDFGTFTGDIYADNQDAKELFQATENELDQLKMVSATGITAITTVDEVPVANYAAVKWIVYAIEEATPANRKAQEVFALNNGTVVDDSVSSVLRVGSNFNISLSVDISGGNMRLRVSSSTAGVTVRVRRLGVYNV